jgi:hypothetical protein
MIILDAITKSVEVVLGGAVAANQAQVVASYVDVTTTTYAPGCSDTQTNGATPVTAIAAPSSATQRQVKLLTVYNADTALITLTVRYNNNSTIRKLWQGTLLPGEELVYMDGIGFEVMGADGTRKIVGPQAGAGGVSVIEASNEQRVLMSDLDDMGTFLGISGTAYWVYLGRTVKPVTIKYGEFHVSTAGAGAQTAEIALCSSPNPPNKGAQTLTKLVADATIDALTGTGVKRNTNALNYAVAAGVHLWAGIRTAMATTQPTYRALGIDMAQGRVLSTAAAGVLTGTGPWTGAIIAASTSGICPDLRLTVD